MLKKIAVGSIVAVLLFGASFNHAAAQSFSISQLVELLINLGVIAPEKVPAARAFLSSQNMTVTTAVTNTTQTAATPTQGQVALGAYHSADTNKDWKISDAELSSFMTLYNYRSGNSRTGEYSLGSTEGTFVPGPGTQTVGKNHSADYDKDWKISLIELSRVGELKNAGGYKVQAGTEDGFAPVFVTASGCAATVINGYNVSARNSGESVTVYQTASIPNGSRISNVTFTCSNGTFVAGSETANISCNSGYTSAGTQCVVVTTTSAYHSADTNQDWKISDSELAAFTALYNYRSGTTRTGDYYVTKWVAGGVIGYAYVAGIGSHDGPTHSGDSNKDWKISLLELTRVAELKNSAGYKVQAGTEDGFAPIAAPAVAQPMSVTSPVAGASYAAGNVIKVTAVNTVVNETYKAYIRGKAYEESLGYFTGASGETTYYYTIPQSAATSGSNTFNVIIKNSAGVEVASGAFSVAQKQTVSSCTDSDGGVNIDVAGTADGRVNGAGSYYTDSSVSIYGGTCSGTSCTGVAEGYCSNGQVTNTVYQCPSGYSVNGACATKPSVTVSVAAPMLSTSSWYSDDSSTWPTVSTPSALTSSQAIRVKTADGAQYLELARGVSSGKLTSSPAAGTTQVILYIYDYTQNTYLVNERTVSVSVTAKPVAVANLSATCSGTANSDTSANWSASATGGTAPYTYSWSVYNDVTSYPRGSVQSSSFTAGYASGGSKQAVVSVRDSGGRTATYTCSVTVTAPAPVATCTDSDGGVNINVAGTASAGGTYFADVAMNSYGGTCSGDGCTSVAEGYCSNGQVTNSLYLCPSGYSVNGACATKPVVSMSSPTLSAWSWHSDDSSTWPTISVAAQLNSNQAMRVKDPITGAQFFDKTLGANYGRLTSSPGPEVRQLQVYVYDYSTGTILVPQYINVSISESPREVDPIVEPADNEPTTEEDWSASVFFGIEDVIRFVKALR